jgi:hypothetical protein
MKKLLLCLWVNLISAAGLPAQADLIRTVRKSVDPQAAMVLFNTRAATPELKQAFFATVFTVHPWEIFSDAQKNELLMAWLALPEKNKTEIRKQAKGSLPEIFSGKAPTQPTQPAATTAAKPHRPALAHRPLTLAQQRTASAGEIDRKYAEQRPFSPRSVMAVKTLLRSNRSIASVDAGSPEFQLSTKNQTGVTDKVGYTKTIGLLDGFPAIGVYGTPYLFRTRAVLLELSHRALVQLPTSVREQIKTNKVDIHVIVSGLLHGGKTERVNNLVFHGWAAKIEGKDRFNANVAVGIFMPKGVKAAPSESAAFGSMKGESVNPHDPLDLSPNNVRFEIEQGRKVATFWSVGQHKDAATVTFHVIINDETTLALLNVCISKALTQVELLECMHNIPDLKEAGKVIEGLLAA